MKNSNNQDYKLRIIKELIILNDDKVFEQVENLINESRHRPKSYKTTEQKLVQRSQQSNKDLDEKAAFTQDEVEKLTQDW